MPHGSGGHRRNQLGLAYLGVLFLIFLMSIGVGKTIEIYSTAQQRMREDELLYIGHTYRIAIKSYYEGSPTVKQYPNSLEELLADKRFPILKRHLRYIYPDPLTGKPFDLIRSSDGRLIGVRSTSKRVPFRKQGFPIEYQNFENSHYYSGWEFVYLDE